MYKFKGSIFLLGIFSIGIAFFIIFNNRIAADPALLTASVTALYSGKEKTIKKVVLLSARLTIPAAGIDSPIESVGLTAAGAVDVPKGPTDAAWFDLGPQPGEIGNAVIVGHSGWKNGIPAVFDNLYTLKKGDEIHVQNADGTSHIFIVRNIAIYDRHQDVSSVFISTDGKAHLNLITCTGVWDVVLKGRLNRLIVFADLK